MLLVLVLPLAAIMFFQCEAAEELANAAILCSRAVREALVSFAKFGVLLGVVSLTATGGVPGGGGVAIGIDRERNARGAPLPTGAFTNFSSSF